MKVSYQTPVADLPTDWGSKLNPR